MYVHKVHAHSCIATPAFVALVAVAGSVVIERLMTQKRLLVSRLMPPDACWKMCAGSR